MRIFLDTANLDELKQAAEWGIVDGVTTNPTLIAKEGRPLTREGIKACSALPKEGIRLNVTLCFSAGSPFVGRIDDTGWNGMDLVRSVKTIYQNCSFKTKILSASLRSPTPVIESAIAGADIGAMPFKVLDMVFNHPLTDRGLEQFQKDWAKVFEGAPAGR